MSGPIEAVTCAAGEQLNLLAGVRLGRLAADAHVGDDQLVLERTLGMDPAGTVVVDGVTYAYGKLGDGTLGQLVVTTPQGTFFGVQREHLRNAVVVDATRDFSALDFVRRAFFVNTAIGEDLSTLGRQLGVLRAPEVADDEQYRRLIRALAYNPRTTLYGLSQALDIMVGEGQYTIVEDPARPSTVDVYLNASGILDGSPVGKTYLSGTQDLQASDGVFTAAGPLVNLGPLHLTPVSFWTRFGAALPPGGPSDAGALAYDYVGDEGTVSVVDVGPGASAVRLGGPGWYACRAALLPQSTWEAGVQAIVPDAAALSDDDARAFGVRVRTTEGVIGAGCVRVDADTVGLGLADLRDAGFGAGDGALLDGVACTVPAGAPFEMHVQSTGDGLVRLWVDGRAVQVLPNATGVVNGYTGVQGTGMDFGAFAGDGAQVAVLAAGLSADCLTDFAAARTRATVKDAQTLTLAAPPLLRFVGLSLRVRAGEDAAASGLYTITGIGADNDVTVSGLGELPVGDEVDVIIAGASSLSGLETLAPILMPVQPLPFPEARYRLSADEVLSACVYDGVGPINRLLDAGPPPLYPIWPIYAHDPASFVSGYLNQMLAAGVQLRLLPGSAL